jgi:hypothetical protein
VTKREYPVLDISDDGFCSLMCDDGSTKVSLCPVLFILAWLAAWLAAWSLFCFTLRAMPCLCDPCPATYDHVYFTPAQSHDSRIG